VAATVAILGGVLAPLAVAQQIENVTLASDSPLITFRILFKTGAASDPAGKEGVAALTAAMLSEGGSREMSYEQIVRALFPTAASVRGRTDKEMTVFSGTTHADNLEKYYSLLKSMLLDPGWREDDFRRLKTDTINTLRVELRGNNDEELGKEALYLRVYGSGHPYGHENLGTVAALEKVTIDDLKAFYRQNYTRANLVIGLTGAYPKGFLERVRADFSKLPEGTPARLELPQPQPARKLRVLLIDKNTRATAISLGFPLPVNRSSKDWPALFLVQTYFGAHRSSNGLLYNQLREVRGLNYGDYAYIEYFPRGMFVFEPEPNLARREQIFQIWIRPVEPQNRMFALRAALYELDKLIRDGMSKEKFESTRGYLAKFVNLLTQTPSSQLGYAIDSKYYGIPDFNGYVKSALAGLTLEDVNNAIKKYLRTTDLDVVAVTNDAQGMKNALLSGAPSPITYVSPKPKEVLDEDKLIESYKLDVSGVDIVPVNGVFEK
jgi:zinc protease